MKTYLKSAALCLLLVSGLQAEEMNANDATLIKVELKNLVDAYAITRDSLDANGHASLFAEDGSLILYGTAYTGYDVLKERVDNASRESVGMHHMSSGKIDIIDDTSATGVHYFTLYIGQKGEDYQDGDAINISNFTVMGKYLDTYVLTEDGWKFAERIVEPVFRPAD